MSNLSVFAFEGQQVRFVGTADNPEWVAANVCEILALNTSEAVNGRKDRPGSGLDPDEKGTAIIQTSGGPQRLLTVNLAGLKRLVTRSRKPHARVLAKQLGIEVLVSCKERDTLDIIAAAFKHFSPVHQFFINGYRIDLYIPQYRLAVECDEYGHMDRCPSYEQLRRDAITQALGCKFVRFNPDTADFNIGNVINQIMLVIYGGMQ